MHFDIASALVKGPTRAYHRNAVFNVLPVISSVRALKELYVTTR